jgi:hypothetical protein
MELTNSNRRCGSQPHFSVWRERAAKSRAYIDYRVILLILIQKSGLLELHRARCNHYTRLSVLGHVYERFKDAVRKSHRQDIAFDVAIQYVTPEAMPHPI